MGFADGAGIECVPRKKKPVKFEYHGIGGVSGCCENAYLELPQMQRIALLNTFHGNITDSVVEPEDCRIIDFHDGVHGVHVGVVSVGEKDVASIALVLLLSMLLHCRDAAASLP